MGLDQNVPAKFEGMPASDSYTTRTIAMPNSRDDAVKKLEWLAAAEATNLLFNALGRAISEQEKVGGENQTVQGFLLKLRKHLQYQFELFSRHPDTVAPPQMIEAKARQLYQSLKGKVEYWQNLNP